MELVLEGLMSDVNLLNKPGIQNDFNKENKESQAPTIDKKDNNDVKAIEDGKEKSNFKKYFPSLIFLFAIIFIFVKVLVALIISQQDIHTLYIVVKIL